MEKKTDDISSQRPADNESSSTSATFSEERMAVNSLPPVQTEKDFKESAKYKDCDSYVAQHHHSIGSGLFLTDEVLDLPPRFKEKVIRALENCAALNNISLDRNPLNLISSVSNEPSRDRKDSDSLTGHTVLFEKDNECSKTTSSKSPFRKNSNRGKDSNSTQYYDSNVISSISQPALSASCNFRKNKTHNNTNFEQKNTSCQEKCVPQYNRNDQKFIPKPFSTKLGNHIETLLPHSKFHPNYSSLDSGSQRNRPHRDIIESDSGPQRNRPHRGIIESDSGPQRNRPHRDIIESDSGSQRNRPHRDIIESDSGSQRNRLRRDTIESVASTESQHQKDLTGAIPNAVNSSKYVKRHSRTFNNALHAGNSSNNPQESQFPKSKNFNSKQIDCNIDSRKKFDKNFNDKQLPPKKSFHSDAKSFNNMPSSKFHHDKDITDDKNVGHSDFSHKMQKNLDSSKSGINSNHNSVGSSYYKKLPYQQPKGEMKMSSRMSNHHKYKSNFSNTSSHSYDASMQNDSDYISSSCDNLSLSAKGSRTSLSTCSNHSFYRGSPDPDKELKSRNISVQNQNLPQKHSNEDSKCNYVDSRKKVPLQKDNYENSSFQSSSNWNSKKFSPRKVNSEKDRKVKTNSIQNLKSSLNESSKFTNNNRGCLEIGFFIKIEVSEEARNVAHWISFLRTIFCFQFDLENCCYFSDILILEFERKEQATEALKILWHQKRKGRNSKLPQIINVSSVIYRLIKPCSCKEKVIQDSINSIQKYAEISLDAVNEKIKEIKNFKSDKKRYNFEHNMTAEREMLKTFEDSKLNFINVKKDILIKVKNAENLKSVQQYKYSFIRECNAFKRCLPIYSKKEEIMYSVRFYSVSIIVAETGSGKSTQLVQYLLHSDIGERGLIVCTQPRKLAAISIAQFVSGQIGSAVGKIVGYDVGIERKVSESTKIIYMTDYCLLKKYLKNRTLKEVSCVIIDEAHERSLYTDLLLGMLKQCINIRLDLRVLITSATINPTVFVDYFKIKSSECVIEVPGRSYPVDVVWLPEDVKLGWNYLDACVKTVYQIYTQLLEGDILVFLTSPNESEEAIYQFKKLLSGKDKKPQLLSLHGKSDVKEQMQIFETLSPTSRKIVFATNVAETSITIPRIKYVVDSGMTKELMFDPVKNKSYLAVTFINKSAAEQRKGRAGRTQSGICYRMYSKKNYSESMADNTVPEILKTNFQKAFLKILELGIDPQGFDFIEKPSERTMSNCIDSLKYLGAIKNNKLTELGRKIVKLPVEPQLAKLILQGIDADIGYETIIIAALVNESNKIFIRNEENKALADEKKKKFCQEGGDLCTYLEIYKKWKELLYHDRYRWCVENYVSSKALKAATGAAYEIITSLQVELGVKVSKKYNSTFKKKYENILFSSFSENLCVLSGHPKLGYLSPYLPESFFIHPSSTISYLGKDLPEFLVYSTLMETTRNFLFDVTPISEETIKLANQSGSFKLPLHSLKSLQVPPKVMGPFGESVLIRHILGKQGCKIKDIEIRIQELTNVKNTYVSVEVDKGLITIFSAQRFHEKISKSINEIIERAHDEMSKEEDLIKLTGTYMHFALTAGGLINDIIMPGEFRELIFNCVGPKQKSNLEKILADYGAVQTISHSKSKKESQICVTYKKVCDAQKAFFYLKDKNLYGISSKPYLPNVCDNTSPLNMLDISWCRCPCDGYGSVTFFSEEDLIVASDMLTSKSFFLSNNLIRFSPSDNSSKELSIKNLPQIVDEETIRGKLRECLPKDMEIKSVSVYRKFKRVTDVDVENAKKNLLKLFSHYVLNTKFVIDIKCFKNGAFWKAYVYFDCPDDAERVFVKLKDNTSIDSFPLSVKQVFKSSLYCKSEVYDVVSQQILSILENKKKNGLCEEFSIIQLDQEYNKSVEFCCTNFQELNTIRQSLRTFLLGESMLLAGNSKLNFLFSDCHAELISKIQKSTNTFINLNKIRKIITIYGSCNNCQNAKKEIYSLAADPDFSFTRTFNLTDSCIPVGFLKKLYTKYGFDLHGLVDEFKLTVASIDNSGGTLTLKGVRNGIKKAEQVLEKLCEELFKQRNQQKKTSNEQDVCSICFDPVSYDFQRLEHCGHAFCRQCLLLQLESNIMPVVCVKENCGKLIFLEDIKKILTFGGSHLKKGFCAVALQYHVSCNIGKLSYCPTPDCQMVYRVTKRMSEFSCPGCRNSTCTHCQVPYHYGMSCEMFQNCQSDENYSLMTWVKENESTSKYCPSCKIVIEKESGCNHMECLNCKAHFCWLCLEIFPNGSKVYDHMPYCPKNQSSLN